MSQLGYPDWLGIQQWFTYPFFEQNVAAPVAGASLGTVETSSFKNILVSLAPSGGAAQINFNFLPTQTVVPPSHLRWVTADNGDNALVVIPVMDSALTGINIFGSGAGVSADVRLAFTNQDNYIQTPLNNGVVYFALAAAIGAGATQIINPGWHAGKHHVMFDSPNALSVWTDAIDLAGNLWTRYNFGTNPAGAFGGFEYTAAPVRNRLIVTNPGGATAYTIAIKSWK